MISSIRRQISLPAEGGGEKKKIDYYYNGLNREKFFFNKLFYGFNLLRTNNFIFCSPDKSHRAIVFS